MMDDRDALSEAMNRVGRILSELATIGGIPPAGKNQGGKGAPLREYIERMLTSEEMLRAGNALTAILQVSGAVQAPLLECIKDEGGYGGLGAGPLNYRACLLNASGRPIVIVTSRRHVADPVRVINPNASGVFASVVGNTGRWHEKKETVPPGGTIWVRAEAAINALYEHCMEAHAPHLWGQSAALPDKNRLVEVGYRCEVDGESIEAPVAQAEPETEPARRRGRPPRAEQANE
jgi:hypothetical protein